MKHSANKTTSHPNVIRRGIAAAISLSLAASMVGLPAAGAYAKDAGDSAVQQQSEQPGSSQALPFFRGSDIVEKYLRGSYDPTLSELESIDFDALRFWDAKMAQQLERLRDDLSANKDSGSGGEAEPAVPAEPSNPEEQPAGKEEATDPSNPFSPDEILDIGMAVPSESDDAVAAVVGEAAPEASARTWSYDGDPAFTMTHYTDNMNAHKLIAAIGEQAREVAQEYGISASEMIALAVAKSFSGTSFMAQAPLRNLFGSVAYEVVDTTEYDEFGVMRPDVPRTAYRFGDDLCAYDTYKACLEDHAYRVATGIEEAVPDDGTWGGPQGSLTNRVQATIEAYDLTRYDQPLDFEPASPLRVHVWNEAAGAYESMEVSLADLVAEATSHLGVPYVWGGTSSSGFDCSGLVQYSFGQALQIQLPRTAAYQCAVGEDVDFADLHLGDLVFFTTADGVCCHVGMYLGEGCYIEAPHEGADVRVTAMDEKVPTFAKRVVSTQAKS